MALVPKSDWEREIFTEFEGVAGMGADPGSITSEDPPLPDIRFTVNGQERFAELVEITDQDLAKNVMISVKTGKITGGAYSQANPVVTAFTSKSQKVYQTCGSPLILLAYYDKQFPATGVEPGLIVHNAGPIAATMIASGVWSRIWVYNRWRRDVLWVYPA